MARALTEPPRRAIGSSPHSDCESWSLRFCSVHASDGNESRIRTLNSLANRRSCRSFVSKGIMTLAARAAVSLDEVRRFPWVLQPWTSPARQSDNESSVCGRKTREYQPRSARRNHLDLCRALPSRSGRGGAWLGVTARSTDPCPRAWPAPGICGSSSDQPCPTRSLVRGIDDQAARESRCFGERARAC